MLTQSCHARGAQALKRLLAVEKHFGDFVEDQFDFHSYCVRKMTLRAYVQMLRMEDRLHHSLLFAKVGVRFTIHGNYADAAHGGPAAPQPAVCQGGL